VEKSSPFYLDIFENIFIEKISCSLWFLLLATIIAAISSAK